MNQTTFWKRRRSAQRVHPVPTRLRVEHLEERALLSVNVLADFAGLNFNANMGNYSPPDTHLAAGPNRLVEVVNTRISYWNKSSGQKIFEQTLPDFFAPLGVPQSGPGVFVGFDPKVSYDELAGRFIVTALHINFREQTSHLLLGVSDDADPRGSWEMHRINTEDKDSYWSDFPQLGWDADAIYVTMNMFHWPPSPTVTHVSVLTIDKASVLDGNNTTLTYFDVDRSNSHPGMQPAIMRGASPGEPMYFLHASSSWASGSQVDVVRMTDKLSRTPTFTDFGIDVPNYAAVPAATQKDGIPVNAHNSFIKNAAWRGGRLVASHTVGTGGPDSVAHARWYEFDTTGAAPTLTQSGELDRGPGVHTYYPSIEIAPNGDFGMTFMQSSTTEYISMYVTGRKLTDPAGVLQTPVLVKAGEAAYRVSPASVDPPPLRAGDYSGIAIDPSDGTFWAGNEYATAPLPEPQPGSFAANWGTWIANFSITSSGSLLSQSVAATASEAAGSLDAIWALLGLDGDGWEKRKPKIC